MLTVVVMLLINNAKREDNKKKWYVLNQLMIFRYLRLFAGSLLLLYVPLLSAYSIDKGNGKQESKDWVWGLVASVIVLLFLYQAVVDVRSIKKKRKDQEEDSVKAMLFSSKPLEQWSEEEVLLWMNIRSMHQESYFTEATRSSIADKLEASRVDGEFLCQYGKDIEKLVQLVGLACGEAMKLTEELSFLNTKGEDVKAEVQLSSLNDNGVDEKKTGSEDMLVDSALSVSKEDDDLLDN